jgi:hypothetical protein
MTTITGIGVGAVAKVGGVVSIAFGFIVGAITFITFLALGEISGLPGDVGINTAVMIGFCLVALPASMGLWGIIIGALWAWIYNLTARWHGGIALTLKQES